MKVFGVAEEFIVSWAKDLPRDTVLALVVDLDRAPQKLHWRLLVELFQNLSNPQTAGCANSSASHGR